MNIGKILLTRNACFSAGRTIVPKGIVVHSTGCNNKYLRRYLWPNDGVIGVNAYGNHWNQSTPDGQKKCVNAFVGAIPGGEVKAYQCLPWTTRPWGCGKGKKGTYNDSYIQFEICEDALNDEEYFNDAFNVAAELCAHLMKEFPTISIENVVSHHEAHELGYGSNHADCDHWLKRFGKDMNWFRSLVKSKLGAPTQAAQSTTSAVASTSEFRVKVKASELNIREGAGTKHKVVGSIKDKGVYTIVATSGNWGLLKSYKAKKNGWISLNSKYVKKL